MLENELLKDDFQRKSYTKEENYRAYKLFSLMDVDGGGTVSLREMNRVLMGDVQKFITCDFDHPDTGIYWELDEESCVVIASIEANSSASKFPFLIEKMKLTKINHVIIPQYQTKSLQLVYRELLKIQDEPVTLEFLEPVLIINRFCCWMDIKIEKHICSVQLPIGAVYNLELFKTNMKKTFTKTHPSLHSIFVSVVPRKKQIEFKSESYLFQLLFGTGPNVKRSCRYALGFSAEDTSMAYYHCGQPMVIDLNLGISQKNLEVLMEELFNFYDADGSGEFEYEEFRNFYIRFLDNDESLQRFKEYAQHRFRDLELEALHQKEREFKMLKAKRRNEMKERSKPIIEKQKEKFLLHSIVDQFGLHRRLISDHLSKRKGVTEEEGGEDERREEKKKGEGKEVLSTKKSFGSNSGAAKIQKIEFNNNNASTSHEDEDVSTPMVPAIDTTQIISKVKPPVARPPTTPTMNEEDLEMTKYIRSVEAMERHVQRTQLHKINQTKRLKRRQHVMKMLLEANKSLHQKEKSKIFSHLKLPITFIEAHAMIRKGLLAVSLDKLKLASKNQKQKKSDGPLKSFQIDTSTVFISPAIHVDTTMISNPIRSEDITCTMLPSHLIHPSAANYYFIRDNNPTFHREYDSSTVHPAFFNSQFNRNPSRHSAVALSIAKLYQKERSIGEQYREENGMIKDPLMGNENKLAKLKFSTEESKIPSGKVKFQSEELIAKDISLLGRVTILSIKLMNLNKVHFLEPNSPFVQMRCGKDWRFVTEVHAFAGRNAQWADLMWIFRIHTGDVVHLSVNSGVNSKFSKIGLYQISAESLINEPLSSDGTCKIQGNLYEKASNSRGTIEIEFFIEPGQEWDWFVFEYKKKEKEKNKLKKMKKLFSRTQNKMESHYNHDINSVMLSTYTEESGVVFPLEICVLEISIFELVPIHNVRKNCPMVVFNCGKMIEQTKVLNSKMFPNRHTSSTWRGLMWKAELMTEKSNMILDVYSNSFEIGRFAISASELLKYSRTKLGEVEIFGELFGMKSNTTTKKLMGKVTLKCIVDVEGSLDVHTANDTDGRSILSMDSNPVVESKNELNTSQLSLTHEGFTGNLLPGINSIFSNTTIPFLVTVKYIEISTIHLPVTLVVIRKPLVSIQLSCENHYHIKTETIPSDHSQFIKQMTWSNVDYQFPIMDRMTFKCLVLVDDHTDIGSAYIRGSELLQLKLNIIGESEIIRTISTGTNENGQIKMIVSCVPIEDKILGDVAIKQMSVTSSRKDDILSGYSSSTIQAMDKGSQLRKHAFQPTNSILHSPNGASNSFSINSTISEPTPAQFPLRISIVNIIAMDLRSVHVFSKNSPYINIACGAFAYSTAPLPNAGDAAMWNGISDCLLDMQEVNTMRLSVWSRLICIGSTKIIPNQLLVAPTDTSGLKELFLFITSDDGKLSGKVKLILSLEFFVEQLKPSTDSLQKRDESIVLPSVAINPPVLITIYTISVFNLKSVHRFQNNQPSLKLFCNELICTGHHEDSVRSTADANHQNESKWEKLMWLIPMETNETYIAMMVQSDTTVIGSTTLTITELLKQPPDHRGISEILCNIYMEDGFDEMERKAFRSVKTPTGSMRITFAYESHYIDDSTPDNDADDDSDHESFMYRPMGMSQPSNHGTASRKKETLDDRLETYKVILTAISLDSLPSVHTLSINSPYVMIQCGKFETITKTKSLSGSSANWRQIIISILMANRKGDVIGLDQKIETSTLTVTIYSGNSKIGSCIISIEDLLKHRKDMISDIGDYTTKLNMNPDLTKVSGNIHITYKIISSDTQESISSNKSKFRPFNSSESMNDPRQISIPFIIKIHHIIIYEMIAMISKYLSQNKLILLMQCDDWKKYSPSAQQSAHSAQWIDEEWIFIITNLNTKIEIQIFSEVKLLGSLIISIYELSSMKRIKKNGQFAVIGKLFYEKQLMGLLKLTVSMSPYMSMDAIERSYQDQTNVDQINPDVVAPVNSMQDDILQPMGSSPLYSIRFNSILVDNLFQVHGLFINSPKVTVLLSPNGGSYSTPVAIEGGTHYEWDNLGWGSIPLPMNGVLRVKVSTGNELIGEITWKVEELVAERSNNERRPGIKFESTDEKGNQLLQLYGVLLDGIVEKGTIRLKCLLTQQEPMDSDSIEDRMIHSTFESFKADTIFNKNIHPSQLNMPSDHTPTPSQTHVSIFGLSVYELKQIHPVFKNSPYVKLTCGSWMVTTGIARFSGNSSEWIVKNNKQWKFSMIGNTFMKISVYSLAQCIGSVVISTRELMKLPLPDAQGLVYLLRNIEFQSKSTGKVCLCLKLQFDMDSANKINPTIKSNESRPPSLLSPVKDSLSNPSPLVTSLVEFHSSTLQLPVTIEINELHLLDIPSVHVLKANSLSVLLFHNPLKMLTSELKGCGPFGHWEDLRWKLNVVTDTNPLVFTILSSGSTVGEVIVTGNELLSMDRNMFGIIELNRVIKKLNFSATSGLGWLKLGIKITPFVTTQQKLQLSSKLNEPIRDVIAKESIRMMAKVAIHVITIKELSLVYPSLTVTVSIGEFKKTTDQSPNQSGHCMWGNLVGWDSIGLYERSNLLLTIQSAEDSGVVLGSAIVHVYDILSAPVDENGLIVLYGDLMEGIVYKGKISMACRIELVDEKLIQTVMQSNGEQMQMVYKNPTEMKSSVVRVLPSFDLSHVNIISITADQLKAVHSVGKNSPMIKLDYYGMKYQSNAKPYAGSKAHWQDLNWSIDLKMAGKMNFIISSSSVVIGSGQVKVAEILSTQRTMEGLTKLELKLQNSKYPDESVGVLVIIWQFLPDKSQEKDTTVKNREEGKNVFYQGGWDQDLANAPFGMRSYDPLGLHQPVLREDNATFHSLSNQVSKSTNPAKETKDLQLIQHVLDFQDEDTRSQGVNSIMSHKPNDEEYSYSVTKSSNPSSQPRTSTSEGFTQFENESTSSYTNANEDDQYTRLSENPSNVSGNRTSLDYNSQSSYAVGSESGSQTSFNSASYYNSDFNSNYSFSTQMHTKPTPTLTSEYGDSSVSGTSLQSSTYKSLDSRSTSRPKTSRGDFLHSVGDNNNASNGKSIENSSNPISNTTYSTSCISHEEHSDHITLSTTSELYDDESESEDVYSSYTTNYSLISESVGNSQSYTNSYSDYFSDYETVSFVSHSSYSSNSYLKQDSSMDLISHYWTNSSHPLTLQSNDEITSLFSGANYRDGIASIFQDEQHPPSEVKEDPPTTTATAGVAHRNAVGTKGLRSDLSVVDEGNEDGANQNEEQSMTSSRADGFSMNGIDMIVSPPVSSKFKPLDNISISSLLSWVTSSMQSNSETSQSSVSFNVEGDPTSKEIDFDLESIPSEIEKSIQPSISIVQDNQLESIEEKTDLYSINNETSSFEMNTKQMESYLRAIQFSISDLCWYHPATSSEEICHFMAMELTYLIVKTVKNGIVAKILSVPFETAADRYYSQLDITRRGVLFYHPVDPQWLKGENQMVASKSITETHRNRIFIIRFVQQQFVVGGTQAMRKLVLHRLMIHKKKKNTEETMSPRPVVPSTITQDGKDAVQNSEKSFHPISNINNAAVEKSQYDSITTSIGPNEQSVVDFVKQYDELSQIEKSEAPWKIKVMIHDILGVDLSSIVEQIFPTRLYLTACKPYGDWAAETPLIKMNPKSLVPAEKVLSWFDLYNKFGWDAIVMRSANCIVFDIHDAGCGLIVAKSMITYERIMESERNSDGMSTIFLDFQIANEFGGGNTVAVARIFIDLSINTYVRTKKGTEYWYGKHRIEHWTNYPLAPIAVGVVRQRYRDIADDYDKQRIVHPCFFGFRIRWKGNDEDESRFVHPMFSGFTLSKHQTIHKNGKGMASKAHNHANGTALVGQRVNPFRWDPSAASQGRCPVCSDGLDGCPRCWMLPIHSDGAQSNPDEFGFDPEAERNKVLQLERQEILIAAKKARKKYQDDRLKHSLVITSAANDNSTTELSTSRTDSSSSSLNSNSVDRVNNTKEKLEIHTNLTNYFSLTQYRRLVQQLFTIYIKVMPSGYVRKVIVDPTDTIFHIYNMFHSHSQFGVSHTPMILLPTIRGYFELHSEITYETDVLLADKRGRDQIQTYHLLGAKSNYVLLYFANYKPANVHKIMTKFFSQNTPYILPSHIDTYYSDVFKIPPDLKSDEMQTQLRPLIETQYCLQQLDLKKSFEQRGRSMRESSVAVMEQAAKKRALQKADFEKQRKLAKIQLEAQLKGLTGKERKIALKKIKQREINKRRTLLFDDEQHKARRKEEMKRNGVVLISDSEDEDMSDEEDEEEEDDADGTQSTASINDIHLEDEEGEEEVSEEEESEEDDETTKEVSSRGSDIDSERRSSSHSTDDSQEERSINEVLDDSPRSEHFIKSKTTQDSTSQLPSKRTFYYLPDIESEAGSKYSDGIESALWTPRSSRSYQSTSSTLYTATTYSGSGRYSWEQSNTPRSDDYDSSRSTSTGMSYDENTPRSIYDRSYDSETDQSYYSGMSNSYVSNSMVSSRSGSIRFGSFVTKDSIVDSVGNSVTDDTSSYYSTRESESNYHRSSYEGSRQSYGYDRSSQDDHDSIQSSRYSTIAMTEDGSYSSVNEFDEKSSSHPMGSSMYSEMVSLGTDYSSYESNDFESLGDSLTDEQSSVVSSNSLQRMEEDDVSTSHQSHRSQRRSIGTIETFPPRNYYDAIEAQQSHLIVTKDDMQRSLFARTGFNLFYPTEAVDPDVSAFVSDQTKATYFSNLPPSISDSIVSSLHNPSVVVDPNVDLDASHVEDDVEHISQTTGSTGGGLYTYRSDYESHGTSKSLQPPSVQSSSDMDKMISFEKLPRIKMNPSTSSIPFNARDESRGLRLPQIGDLKSRQMASLFDGTGSMNSHMTSEGSNSYFTGMDSDDHYLSYESSLMENSLDSYNSSSYYTQDSRQMSGTEEMGSRRSDGYRSRRSSNTSTSSNGDESFIYEDDGSSTQSLDQLQSLTSSQYPSFHTTTNQSESYLDSSQSYQSTSSSQMHNSGSHTNGTSSHQYHKSRRDDHSHHPSSSESSFTNSNSMYSYSGGSSTYATLASGRSLSTLSEEHHEDKDDDVEEIE